MTCRRGDRGGQGGRRGLTSPHARNSSLYLGGEISVPPNSLTLAQCSQFQPGAGALACRERGCGPAE